jgi:hypothetical protein
VGEDVVVGVVVGVTVMPNKANESCIRRRFFFGSTSRSRVATLRVMYNYSAHWYLFQCECFVSCHPLSNQRIHTMSKQSTLRRLTISSLFARESRNSILRDCIRYDARLHDRKLTTQIIFYFSA